MRHRTSPSSSSARPHRSGFAARATATLAAVACGALLALGTAPAAHAQAYPSKPVRIIAPFAAGGLADVLARALAERLNAQIGGPFIVENRTGAGGNVGADVVAKAEPDGYTLLLTSTGILTINQSLYAKMPFDAETAFAPITVIADMPMLVVVRADLAPKSVPELIALAKAEPDKLFFGSPGNGTTGHLGLELFKAAAGVRIAHVPYKSAAEAVTAAIAGQTAGMFDNPPTVVGQMKAGKLRALGVAAKERLAILPDVPTIAEQGVAGFEASSWFGLVAPAKTPRAVIDRLHEQSVAALRGPEMQARFRESGARLVGNTPDEFAKFIVAERAKWGGLIRSAGVKIE
jgi:tripartite-type tricarboxylate transporter receptor subunit TctC